MVVPTDTPYALGLTRRPWEPGELRYRFTAHLTTPVDTSIPRSIAAYRVPVRDQGSMGACVAFAVTSALDMLANLTGRPPTLLSPLWLYARTRQHEGTFPEDAGSDPRDAGDLTRAGCVSEAVRPYTDDPSIDPPASDDADAPNQDFMAAHRGLYRTDPGGFVAGICAAFDEGLPVTLGMAWRSEFFDPHRGVLPVLPATNIIGGHEILAWGWQPGQLSGFTDVGLVWCRNSWGVGWGGSDLHPDAEYGDFAIPAELFTNGVVWDATVFDPEPVPVPPPAPDCRDQAHAAIAQVRETYEPLSSRSTRRRFALEALARADTQVDRM